MSPNRETPGAITPWPAINQLLPADERFAVTCPSNGYLLAPKSVARLSALLYVLKEQNLAFHIAGMRNHPFDLPLTVSTRALKQVQILNQDTVAVEAGCDLRTLHATLLQEKKELALEDWIWRSQTSSVASVVVRGCHSGCNLTKIVIQERLIGLEIAKLDGGLLRWGRELPAAKAGPPLQQLVWGIGDLQAVIVKCYFQADSIPSKRIWLNWSFKDRPALWQQLKQLQQFASSWERLDVVIPGNQLEKAFIIAQISGTAEEMELFAKHCPGFEIAEKKNQLLAIKNFLQQKFPHFNSVSFPFENLATEDYLWYHVLTNQCWLATTQRTMLSPVEKEPWKSRLHGCLRGN